MINSNETGRSGLAVLGAAVLALASIGCQDPDRFVNTCLSNCSPAGTIEVVDVRSEIDRLPTYREEVQVLGRILGDPRPIYVECFVYTEDYGMDTNWVKMDVDPLGERCEDNTCENVFIASYETNRDWEFKDPWTAVVCVATNPDDHSECDGYFTWVNDDDRNAEEDGTLEQCMNPDEAADLGYGECPDGSATVSKVFDVSAETALLIKRATIDCNGYNDCDSGCN